MWIILTLILFFATILETITTIPLALIVLLCLYIVFEKPTLFILAFFSGLFLDLFLLRILGQSSLFFVLFLIVVFMYERRFEIKTLPFVFIASFLGALFYLLTYGNNYVLGQTLVSSVIAVLLFNGLKKLEV